MKVLLDFDGTLTNIQHEQEFELALLKRLVHARCGVAVDVFESLYAQACHAIADAPGKFGWFDNGRISAYCDEDLFMIVASAVTLIDHWIEQDDERTRCIAQNLRDAGTTLMALTDETHTAIHEQPLCAFNTPEPEVVTAIRTLIDRDCEIVVASNSPAPRIIEKFEHVGLKPVDHDDNPSASFRVRGLAKKFCLGDNPNEVAFGSRGVDIDRPYYADIIRRERPQVIVGDVFSLDLALPLEMARREPMIYEDMQLYLRMRTYTPQWAIDCALNPAPEAPVIVRLLNHFNELPTLILKR